MPGPIDSYLAGRYLSDAASFDDRFDTLARLAFRVASRVLAGSGDAENVAAETLARAQLDWRRIHGYSEPWVVTVATRLAIREARRPPRMELKPEPIVDDVANASVERMDLARALSHISRRQRQAVALRYLADLPESEAAQAMNCSVSSFRTHCGRGLAALQTQLREIPDWMTEVQERNR